MNRKSVSCLFPCLLAFLLLLSLFVFPAAAEGGNSGPLLADTPAKRAVWNGSFSGGKWTLDTYTGEMTVTGSGALNFYSTDYVPWRGQVAYIKNVTLVGDFTSVGNYAFANCPLFETIQFPASITSIGKYAFSGCSSLKEMTLPEGVTSIDANAFLNCTALTTIHLPASLTTLNGSAFAGCTALQNIDIAPGNTAFSSQNGFLYNADGSILYFCPSSLSGTFTVPESVTRLDSSVLANCPNVTTIVLHDKLTWAEDAFAGAAGLVNIVVKDTNPLYKTIDGVLFSKDGSTLLLYPASRSGHYNIPGGTVSIASYAFAKIGNPLTVSLPEGLREISDYAFQNSTGLTRLDTSSGLLSIGNHAFYGCSALVSIELPDTLTALGSYVFYNCSALETVSIPQSITELKEYSFYHCSALKAFDFHPALKTLGNYCFEGCSALKSLTLPKSVTSIGWNCFYGCSGLESLVIEEGRTSLGYAMFEHCSSLKQVSLPQSLTSLGSYAFASCSSLESIVLPSNLKDLGNYSFRYCTALGSIELPEGMTSIASSAFSGCTSLRSVRIPATVKTINSNAFENCPLEQIALPAELTTLGNYVFRNCPLTTLELPSKLKTIGQNTFSNTKITTLFIPSSVTSIGSYAFSGNADLKNVHFLGDAPTVAANSFQDCSADFSIRYLSYRANWTSPQWNGYNCAPWAAHIESTADCENPGVDTVTCTLCSASCALPASALGHSYSPWAVALRPTEENAGIWERSCTRCAKKETESIPAMLPTEQTPFLTTNKNYQNYDSYAASPMTSFLVENPDGSLSRIEYHGGIVMVEQYDAELNYLSSQQLPMELPIFGGFYCGEEYNFLLFGQRNPNQDDSLEVMRVVRYSKDWLRLGHASLCGANTTTPFRAGCPRMAEYGDMLYVHASHEMYKSSDGLNHQSNMTFSIYIPEMEITDARYLVSYEGTSYVSHSFNQFIQIDGDRIITLDHGDAYPRSMVLAKFPNPAGKPKFTGSGSCTLAYVLTLYGATGANATGASIGGLQISDSSYLTAGNSIVQDGSVSTSGQRNIFVTVTPRDSVATNSTTFRWITNYAGDTKIPVSTPHLVKINSNSFLLLWTAESKLYYLFLDGQGQSVSRIYDAPGYALSDCSPLVFDGKVLWYVTDSSKPVFFAIDPNSPEKPILYNGTINITFSAKGYEIDGTTITKTVGETFGELPVLVPQKAALSFSGWRASKTSGGSVSGLSIVTADSVVSAFCDITLTAQWTRASHSCDYSIILNTIPANCLSGKKELRECSQCYNTQTWTWSGKGPHSEVNDPAYGPNCITTGLTAGKHCSLCNTVLTAQDTIPAVGHRYVEDRCCDCGQIRSTADFLPVSNLNPGDRLLILCPNMGKELTAFHPYDLPFAVGTAYSEDGYTAAVIFELQTGYTGNSFALRLGDRFLSWEEGDSLSHSSELNANSSWHIRIAGQGQAEITNCADPTRSLQWKDAEGRFACYTTEESPVALYAPSEKEADLVSRSISLGGNIAVNFYMSLSDRVAAMEDAYMRFTMADGELRSVSVADCVRAERRGNSYYVFTCEVSAKEMTDIITAQFFYGDTSTEEYTYSVKTYADKILSVTTKESLRDLLTAMLRYGGASQTHFAYHTDLLAGEGLSAPDYSSVSIPFSVNRDQGTALVRFAGASLLLKSETTLRIFFQVEETAASSFSVSHQGQPLELHTRQGMYYVDIPNIAANELGQTVDVLVRDGWETATVSYCPLAYCASVLEDAKDRYTTELKNVVASLYLYHTAALTYLGA